MRSNCSRDFICPQPATGMCFFCTVHLSDLFERLQVHIGEDVALGKGKNLEGHGTVVVLQGGYVVVAHRQLGASVDLIPGGRMVLVKVWTEIISPATIRKVVTSLTLHPSPRPRKTHTIIQITLFSYLGSAHRANFDSSLTTVSGGGCGNVLGSVTVRALVFASAPAQKSESYVLL